MFRKKQFSLNPFSTLIAGLFAAAAPAYAFDPNDPADVALLDERIAAAVDPLKAHNKKLLGELKVAKKGAEIDPAEVERLETELATVTQQLADATKAAKTAATAAEKAAADLAGERGFNERLLVDNGLNAALLEAGVQNPAHLKGAAALIRGNKVEVTIEGENRVAKIGGKPLADFVKEWSQSDDGKAYVSAPGNGGGGAKGSDGKGVAVNPWAKDSFDLTAQGKAYKQDPAQAKALAAQHGVTLE